MAGEDKVSSIFICFAICCLISYGTISGVLIAVGDRDLNSTLVTNGTLLSVSDCSLRCYDYEVYGSTCYLKFACNVTWNYGNETYVQKKEDVDWSVSDLNCTNMEKNATVAAVFTKDRPEVLKDLQPYPYVYESTLKGVGLAMIYIFAFIFAIMLVSYGCTKCSDRSRRYQSI